MQLLRKWKKTNKQTELQRGNNLKRFQLSKVMDYRPTLTDCLVASVELIMAGFNAVHLMRLPTSEKNRIFSECSSMVVLFWKGLEF